MGKRGIFRNKKAIGSMIFVEVMQLLVVMFILISSLLYVNNQLDKVGFYKTFFARDMGIMNTAIYGIPGNVKQFYDISPADPKESEAYNFTFQLLPTFVLVNASTAKDQSVYWYFSSYGMEPTHFDEKIPSGTAILEFQKEANRIEVGTTTSSNSFNAESMICPFIDTFEKGWLTKNFVFDAAHGEKEEDKGGVNEDDSGFFESDVTMSIATKLGNKGFGNKKFTRKSGEFKKLEEREEIVKGTDDNTVIISIHVGNNSDKNVNYIKAYYNIFSDDATKLKNRKMGCKILNSILENSDDIPGGGSINGANVIPSDSAYIQKIIPKGKIGIILELGNIQRSKDGNILDRKATTELVDAIFEGLGSHYLIEYEKVGDED